MNLITGRFPDYFINKWADVSYSIGEKGLIPALNDLAKFVKQQQMTQDLQVFLRCLPRKQEETERNDRMEQITRVPNSRRTSSFVIDFDAKDTGRRPETCDIDGQNKPPRGTQDHTNWLHAPN